MWSSFIILFIATVSAVLTTEQVQEQIRKECIQKNDTEGSLIACTADKKGDEKCQAEYVDLYPKDASSKLQQKGACCLYTEIYGDLSKQNSTQKGIVDKLHEVLNFPNKGRTPQLGCISNQNLSPLTSIIKDDKLSFFDDALENKFYLKLYCGNAQALSIGTTVLSAVLGILSY